MDGQLFGGVWGLRELGELFEEGTAYAAGAFWVVSDLCCSGV